MKIHTIFVEPANYTQDLIENVFEELEITYSFFRSNSEATDVTGITSRAKYVFDHHNSIRNVRYLWACSKQNNLVIINGYNHSAFLWLWIFSFFNSNFIGIESDTPYKPKKGLKEIIKRIYLGLLFANKRILGLAGGNGLHKKLFLNYGIPIQRIFLLPMVVNNNKYINKSGSTQRNGSEIKFIYVGRLVPQKNIGLLIKSFQNILKNGKNASLEIVGDGACKKELYKQSGNNSSIHFLGKKFGTELIARYHTADVLVLPSFSEPWGLVINEALASGVPVICSNVVGASSDLVVRPDSGWIFNNNNEQELTKILGQVIDSPETVRMKGAKGQEFMLSFWNYSLYKECLNQIIKFVNKA